MTDPVEDARSRFPAGMAQPEHGFRFAVDSLLLAGFAPRADRVLDLGTGCGVIGLGYLLLHEAGPTVLGVDSNARMISCARLNAKRLGLSPSFQPLLADVVEIRRDQDLQPESFDLVLLNPPFRIPGSGRLSVNPLKRAARFEELAGARGVSGRSRLWTQEPRIPLPGLSGRAAGRAPRVIAGGEARAQADGTGPRTCRGTGQDRHGGGEEERTSRAAGRPAPGVVQQRRWKRADRSRSLALSPAAQRNGGRWIISSL
jgi:SAM-dependent methyltransferase